MKPNLGTQADKKASLAAWIEFNGGYGVAVNVSGIPIKGDKTKFRKNPAMSGMGDVLCCWRGAFIYFEFKRPKNDKLRKSQEEHRVRTQLAGGAYHQISTVDEGIAILQNLKTQEK